MIFLFVNSKKRIYVIDVKDTYGNRVKRVKLGGAKAKARTKTEMVKDIEFCLMTMFPCGKQCNPCNESWCGKQPYKLINTLSI